MKEYDVCVVPHQAAISKGKTDGEAHAGILGAQPDGGALEQGSGHRKRLAIRVLVVVTIFLS